MTRASARGGWVGRIAALPELAKVALDEALGAEALLLGRRSYEWLAARWPSRSGELADRLNSLPKYVVSSTLEDPDWNNSTVLKGDVVNEVSKLKHELDGEIVVPASFQLVQHADRARPRRRAAAEDLPGRARRRRAPLRRDQRQETDAPRRHPDLGDGIAILTYEPVRDAWVSMRRYRLLSLSAPTGRIFSRSSSTSRLFGETSDKKPMRLIDTQILGDGLVGEDGDAVPEESGCR